MKPREKQGWMSLYIWELGFLWVAGFVIGLGGKPDNVLHFGIMGFSCILVITLVLLFRITYLKGKNSK